MSRDYGEWIDTMKIRFTEGIESGLDPEHERLVREMMEALGHGDTKKLRKLNRKLRKYDDELPRLVVSYVYWPDVEEILINILVPVICAIEVLLLLCLVVALFR